MSNFGGHSVVPSLPSVTYALWIAVKKHELFFFLSSFTGLLHFGPNIMSEIVDLYLSNLV